ncbi:MAG: T9SS type A sorting domain-containing protein [Ignavibacteria bacterium]|nr:T9SS type A sorting domain-containing protein [Ignavibacteria bacterium]
MGQHRICKGADEPYCIRFSSENTGWVGGTYGEIFKSTNGGSDWKKDSAGTTPAFISSFYSNNDSAWWGVGGGGKIIYTETCGTPVGISLISSVVPESFSLKQNYPNPFNPETKINYQIKTSGEVKLIVYNILGKEITTLVNDRQQPGSYQVTFDSGEYDLTSGIYIYSLFINNRLIDTKKMSLIK